MKAFVILLLVAGIAGAAEPAQTVFRSATRLEVDAPAAYFTGEARITPQFEANATSPVTGGYVTFAPGARSAWHTHPAGQRLLIVSGVGRTQVWGGPVVELHADDVVGSSWRKALAWRVADAKHDPSGADG